MHAHYANMYVLKNLVLYTLIKILGVAMSSPFRKKIPLSTPAYLPKRSSDPHQILSDRRASTIIHRFRYRRHSCSCWLRSLCTRFHTLPKTISKIEAKRMRLRRFSQSANPVGSSCSALRALLRVYVSQPETQYGKNPDAVQPSPSSSWPPWVLSATPWPCICCGGTNPLTSNIPSRSSVHPKTRIK